MKIQENLLEFLTQYFQKSWARKEDKHKKSQKIKRIIVDNENYNLKTTQKMVAVK